MFLTTTCELTIGQLHEGARPWVGAVCHLLTSPVARRAPQLTEGASVWPEFNYESTLKYEQVTPSLCLQNGAINRYFIVTMKQF